MRKEREDWEEENTKFFVYLVETYNLGKDNKLCNDIYDFIRSQREQAIIDFLKGEGAQQYIAEIKEQAKREGVEAAIEAINQRMEKITWHCERDMMHAFGALRSIKSKLL